MKHIVVSGGEADPGFVRDFLAGHPDAKIIAADRGLHVLDEIGTVPDLILGDYDSAGRELVSRYEKAGVPTEHYRAEKDFTDTEAAVRKAVEEKSEGIFLLGAAGGRLDHFLANVQILLIPLKKKIPAEIDDPQNRILLLDAPLRIRKEEAFGKYVSLLPFSEKVTGITLTGFRYPLENYTLARGGTVGVSNEIQSKTAGISFTGGILMLIMSKDREEK